MKISKFEKHESMPKGYFFLTALFNFIDGFVNMIFYFFNKNIDISVSYQKYVYKKQKKFFALKQ